MFKKMRILTTVLILLMALTCLVGCGSGNDSNAGDQEGLPAHFTAYDISYSISSFTIETNEDGNTIVKCEGSDFSVLPMRNNSFMMPLSCVLVVDGSEVSYSSSSTGGEGIEFEFDGVYEPQTVIFMAGDDDTQRVEVAVN